MANVQTAEKAKLMYEAGQDFTDFTALTNDGDNKTYTSDADLFSARSGYEPEIRPNGLITGGTVTPGSSNDTADVAALTCYLAGDQTSVSEASGESVTRPTDDVAKIDSITVTAAGAIAVVEGTEATSGTTFSSERGAAGGPPWIPSDSIEIAQVRMTSMASAPIAEDEIKQIVGTHCERFDYPVWEVSNRDAQVEFVAALSEIHSDDSGSTTSTKGVYAKYYEPQFTEQPYASDFTPPENSHSVNSTQVYGATIASTSASLGQGSFTALLKDGVTDNLIGLKDETLWFKFYPDRNKSPYLLCQGKLGISRSYPAGDNISASCTISATETGKEVSS